LYNTQVKNFFEILIKKYHGHLIIDISADIGLSPAQLAPAQKSVQSPRRPAASLERQRSVQQEGLIASARGKYNEADNKNIGCPAQRRINTEVAGYAFYTVQLLRGIVPTSVGSSKQ